jgi:hypothetical protein
MQAINCIKTVFQSYGTGWKFRTQVSPTSECTFDVLLTVYHYVSL